MSELYLRDNENKVKISMKHLTKEFILKKSTITAFKDINLKINEGEFWCFVGPSGCGKTTLLRVLADLEYPTSGELKILQENKEKPLNSMVFQEHALFPWMTVWDNIAYGLRNRKVAKNIVKQTVEDYIERTGLQKFAKAYPNQLSGGMKQRVSIARAFANDPEILLMDEPFASLDEQNRLLLQQELLQIWESNRKTVVFITHSIDEAIFLSDHIMLMSAHPGVMKNVYSVNIPRPRIMSEIRKSKEFNELFLKIWSLLKEEVIR
ncbi:MAG: ABC-type nitrate/sulfonate/bicarbonate transport system, ATPase component [Clostridiaceae bacterium]|jgi:NitT/TauT family transport system ATP-binding protein|nr:ABC-type nitrate/sulfonate/bicarbonate transport system, ATPase component [Clostridiaceae bacterium]